MFPRKKTTWFTNKPIKLKDFNLKISWTTKHRHIRMSFHKFRYLDIQKSLLWTIQNVSSQNLPGIRKVKSDYKCFLSWCLIFKQTGTSSEFLILILLFQIACYKLISCKVKMKLALHCFLSAVWSEIHSVTLIDVYFCRKST